MNKFVETVSERIVCPICRSLYTSSILNGALDRVQSYCLECGWRSPVRSAIGWKQWEESHQGDALSEENRTRILALFTEREDILMHIVREVFKANGNTRRIEELIASRPDWRRKSKLKSTRQNVQQYCRRVRRRIRTKADDIHVLYDGKSITITA
jgi:hypothetical protein